MLSDATVKKRVEALLKLPVEITHEREARRIACPKTGKWVRVSKELDGASLTAILPIICDGLRFSEGGKKR